MTPVFGNLYTALRSANVPEDKAREAAEEVYGHQRSSDAFAGNIKFIMWLLTAIVVLLVWLFFIGLTIYDRLGYIENLMRIHQ